MRDGKIMIQWRVRPSGQEDQKSLRASDRNWTPYTRCDAEVAERFVNKRNTQPAFSHFEFRLKPTAKRKVTP